MIEHACWASVCEASLIKVFIQINMPSFPCKNKKIFRGEYQDVDVTCILCVSVVKKARLVVI